MEEDPITTEATIMAALSTLSPHQLSTFTDSISALFCHHRHRLSSVLSSPSLFSFTLLHLHSLSLPQKSLLIANHLLSALTPLALALHRTAAAQPPPVAKLRDLDSALLLLLLCELRQHDPLALETPITNWRLILSTYLSGNILTLSDMGFSNSSVLSRYVTMVAKCLRFVSVMGFSGGGGGKRGREVAAAVAAVVALPSVEVVEGGKECVVCKEEMREGRDVCELPCGHLFHWMCILPWLQKRNTCPCCRFRLPSDDVSGEIDRLWEVIATKAGFGSFYRECR